MPVTETQPKPGATATPAVAPATAPTTDPALPAAPAVDETLTMTPQNRALVAKGLDITRAALKAGDPLAAAEGMMTALKAADGGYTAKTFPLIRIDPARGAGLSAEDRSESLLQVFRGGLSLSGLAGSRDEGAIQLQALDAAHIALTGEKAPKFITPDETSKLTREQLAEQSAAKMTAIHKASSDKSVRGKVTIEDQGLIADNIEQVTSNLPSTQAWNYSLKFLTDIFDAAQPQWDKEPKAIEFKDPLQLQAVDLCLANLHTSLASKNWDVMTKTQDTLEMALTGKVTPVAERTSGVVLERSISLATTAALGGQHGMALQLLETGYVAKFGGKAQFDSKKIAEMNEKDPSLVQKETMQMLMKIHHYAHQTGDTHLAMSALQVYGKIHVTLAPEVKAQLDPQSMAQEANKTFKADQKATGGYKFITQ